MELKIKCMDKEGIILYELNKHGVDEVKTVFETLDKEIDKILDIRDSNKDIHLIKVDIIELVNGTEYSLGDLILVKDKQSGGFVHIGALMLNGLSMMLNMTKDQLAAARMGLTQTGVEPKPVNNTTASGIIL